MNMNTCLHTRFQNQIETVILASKIGSTETIPYIGILSIFTKYSVLCFYSTSADDCRNKFKFAVPFKSKSMGATCYLRYFKHRLQWGAGFKKYMRSVCSRDPCVDI